MIFNLTIRALRYFLTILPISNTDSSAADILTIFHFPFPTWSTTFSNLLAQKFPPYSIFRPKCGWKAIECFSHFYGLITETNYEHLECFVMLETHSQVHRGQMSHICGISPLSVKFFHNTIVYSSSGVTNVTQFQAIVMIIKVLWTIF